MNNLTIYNNPAFGDIRGTLDEHGEPWFVGRDVAKALGYGDDGKAATNAVARHVDPEDKGVTEIVTPGGKQNIVTINESGLYALILSSKLPTAKQFKRWVTSEVLPAIRRTGTYTNPKAAPAVDELKQKRLQIMETNAKVRVAKQIRKLLVALLLCAFLTGCTTVREGTVINKYYSPAYSTILPIWTGNHMTYIPQYHPEEFYITIQGLNEDGDEDTAIFSVPEYVFNTINIGDHYKQGLKEADQ